MARKKDNRSEFDFRTQRKKTLVQKVKLKDLKLKVKRRRQK